MLRSSSAGCDCSYIHEKDSQCFHKMNKVAESFIKMSKRKQIADGLNAQGSLQAVDTQNLWNKFWTSKRYSNNRSKHLNASLFTLNHEYKKITILNCITFSTIDAT